MQSINYPAKTGPQSVSDMPSLEEMHIGGNELTDDPDQSLPAAYLHNKPNLKLVNLSHANLPAIDYDAFVHSPKLEVLDVSFNRLTSKTFFNVSTTNLTQIILTSNELDSISPEMCNQLESLDNLELDLGGNPLRCDCTTMEFVHWAHQVKDHITFVAPEYYFCIHTVGGSTLFTVDLAEMRVECEVWRHNILIVGTTLLALLLLVGGIAAIKKRWFIRHYLIVLQEWIHKRRETEPGEEFVFDAFVLYSNKLEDRKWVHAQLVKPMERTYGFKFCIHLRDFICGLDIVDNVEMAIKKSRKVIAVVTPNFAESLWCIDELQMTRSIENEDNKRKLIVILLQDFPDIPADIPQVIRKILDSQSCLIWPEHEKQQKQFWKSLVKSLYHKAPPPARTEARDDQGDAYNYCMLVTD